MTTVTALPASAPTVRAGRSTTAAPGDEFAALLAGIMPGPSAPSAVVDVDATAPTVVTTLTGPVAAATGAPAPPADGATPGVPAGAPAVDTGLGAVAAKASPPLPATSAPVAHGAAAGATALGPATAPPGLTAAARLSATAGLAIPAVPAGPQVDGATQTTPAADVPIDAVAPAADAAVPEEPLSGSSEPVAGIPAAAPATGTALAAGAEGALLAPLSEARAVAPAAAPAPPAAPPPPAAQVVTVLEPLLAGPDGAYTISLQLYPEELGAVQVEVSLRGGEISLALHAADDRAQEALRAALPDLREQLESTGLTATDVSVDGGRADDSANDTPGQRPGSRDRSTGDGDVAPAPPPAADPDAALDLRM